MSKGVRGHEFPWAIEARGLPDDVSPTVQNWSDEWDADGHSHSWLTLQELKLLQQDAKEYFSDSIAQLIANCEGYSHPVRIVFFFDN